MYISGRSFHADHQKTVFQGDKKCKQCVCVKLQIWYTLTQKRTPEILRQDGASVKCTFFWALATSIRKNCIKCHNVVAKLCLFFEAQKPCRVVAAELGGEDLCQSHRFRTIVSPKND